MTVEGLQDATDIEIRRPLGTGFPSSSVLPARAGALGILEEPLDSFPGIEHLPISGPRLIIRGRARSARKSLFELLDRGKKPLPARATIVPADALALARLAHEARLKQNNRSERNRSTPELAGIGHAEVPPNRQRSLQPPARLSLRGGGSHLLTRERAASDRVGPLAVAPSRHGQLSAGERSLCAGATARETLRIAQMFHGRRGRERPGPESNPFRPVGGPSGPMFRPVHREHRTAPTTLEPELERSWSWGESNALWADSVAPRQRVFAQVSGGFWVMPDHVVSQGFCTSCVALVSWIGHDGEVSELLDVDVDHLDELCRQYGIARLEVFGSVARGEPDDGSDIDLLYELAPDAQLGWEIIDLEDELADLFGRPVDLVSKRALHKMLRSSVLAEARLIHTVG